jgi:hypothetical protein
VPDVDAELDVRAKAYAMYRTLRRSGLAWEMFRVRQQQPKKKPELVKDDDSRRSDEETTDGSRISALGYAAKYLLTGFVVVLGVVLILSIPQHVLGALALVLATGLVAGGALWMADRAGEKRRSGRSGQRSKAVDYVEVRQ